MANRESAKKEREETLFAKIFKRHQMLDDLVESLLAQYPSAARLVFFENTTNRRGISLVLFRKRPIFIDPTNGQPVEPSPTKPPYRIAQISFDIDRNPILPNHELGKDLTTMPELAYELLSDAAKSLRHRQPEWHCDDLLFMPAVIVCQASLWC